ncbi:capsule biosynthesis GfcC D2 domain-containing protein [Dickeya sp. NCPPB 3274]|uniref:capsule biosynthesis GfcC D2 domain-containing protein n=1 Tax=Dickeya sp. NCPPB 3274 TaxID=568766 RepID=UPI0003A4ECA4|nr:capsule biosynthesis GfcC D2 domain-containing protein [Dickeya sp. NCPPB 3274]
MLSFNRLAALLLLVAGTSGAAQLTVKYAGETLPAVVLKDGTRLDQFYGQMTFPDKVNWQTALLTNELVTEKVREKGEKLQARLYQLQLVWQVEGDGDWAIAAWYMAQALKQVNTVGRIRASIDPDIVRLSQRDNRPLVGNYTLYLSPYRDQFFLFGLISTGIDIGTPNVFKDIDLQSGWSIEQYIGRRRFLPGGDNRDGYLISSNGRWRKVPLAIWNRQHNEPAAGETLFIGFDPSILPEGFTSLNEQIADYLANRIPH